MAINLLMWRWRANGSRDAFSWLISGLKLAIRQRRLSYSEWIDRYDSWSDDEHQLLQENAAKLTKGPLISIIMPTYNPPERWLTEAIESVRCQLYMNWELCIADDASTAPHVRDILEKYMRLDSRIRCDFRAENGHISLASNSALELAKGEFVALLDHDDLLAEHALYMVALELNRDPSLDIVYSDEDKISDEGQRYEPQFKPAWNANLLRSTNFISHLGVYRRTLVISAGCFRKGFEGSQDYDLVLRCSELTTTPRIRHIPYILYHWRAIEGSVALDTSAKSYAYDAAIRGISSHVERLGETASVEFGATVGQYRVKYVCPASESVAVIVNGGNDSQSINRCVSSILRNTNFPNYKIYVVETEAEHESRSSGSSSLDSRVESVRCEPTSTRAAKGNIAARRCCSDLLCFVDSQVEVCVPSWLGELASQASREGIGVVGSKILGVSGFLLHSGFVFDHYQIGGHVGRGSCGAYFATDVAREFAAVSASCAVFNRSGFVQGGMFDEQEFGDCLYAVDLCLKLGLLGLKVLWTPYSEVLLHRSAILEQVSRDVPKSIVEIEQMRLCLKWKSTLFNDANLNPNLELHGNGFVLAFPPRNRKARLAESIGTPYQ